MFEREEQVTAGTEFNLYYDDNTLTKVREALDPYVDQDIAICIISSMQNKGILFRERAKEEVDGNN